MQNKLIALKKVILKRSKIRGELFKVKLKVNNPSAMNIKYKNKPYNTFKL